MDLDPVREEFLADVSNFVNNIELAIEASRHFRDEVLADVEAIRAAIDSLPEERVIHIRTVYDNGAPDTGATGDAFDNALAEAEAMQLAAASRDAGDAGSYEAMVLRELRDISASLMLVTSTLGESEQHLAIIQRDTADASADLMMQTELLRGSQDRQTSSALDQARATYMLAMAQRMQANSARDAARANRDAAAYDAAGAGGGGGGGGGFWGFLGRDIPMMAGLLPSIRGWHIALDAVFESAIALGTALAALAIGLAAMVPASQDIYTHLKSVQAVNAALKDQIPTLGGGFDRFAESAGNASHVLEAYGGLINAVSGQTGVFAGVAKEVVAGIDDWVARLDLFMAHQSNAGKLLQDGVGFLSQFRQAIDNVAMAISHLLVADPGTAHYLMDIVVGATKVLDVITMLPAPILEAALALHSFWLWGGLMGTGMGNLLGPLRAMALGMGDVAAENIALTASTEKAGGFAALKATVADIGAGFASWAGGIKSAVSDAEGLDKVGAGLGSTFSFVNPVAAGVAVLAAGIGFLTYEMLQSSQASQQFGAAVDKAMTQDTATQFLVQYPQLLQQQSTGLKVALGQQTDAWKSYNIATHNTVEDLKNADFPGLFENAGKAIGDFFSSSVKAQQATNAIGTYTGKLATLNQGQKQILQDMDAQVKSGNSVAQSFALLDLAGVTASDSLALADQKVKNLITGYQAMSVQGNLLSGAVNAVTFASEQQQSKVQALTQAYSTWFSTITGGVSTFTTFATQAIGLYGALSSGAATLSSRNGEVAVSMQGLAAQSGDTTVSMTGLNAASLNAQQTFIQSASAAQNQYNSLLTLASAAGLGSKGTGMLTGAMKDYMAILMPAAGNNKALQQTLVSMYQEINPNVTSFGQLQSAVGNIKNPMQALQNVTTTLTVAAGNLTQDVQNLAQAIGQNLNQAMAAAILQANGGQQAFDNYATAVLSGNTSSKQLHDTALQLAEKLITVTGNTKSAENEFIVMSGQMGVSQQAAIALWNSVVTGAQNADNAVAKHAADIANSLNGIPKLINIGVNFTTSGSALVNPGTGTVYKTGGHTAQGGYITGGIAGQDSVPIMAMPGEVVVPTAMVNAGAVDHLRGKIPGFAAGGRVGHQWDMADVFAQWGREMWANDLHGHGRGHPIGQAAMEALLAAVTQPGKLSGIWDSPQWRDYAKDLKADMGPYASKDLEYWKVLGERSSLSAAERKSVLHLEHLLHEDHLHHRSTAADEKALETLRNADAKTLAGYAKTLAVLNREGFAAGGLVRSYDSGGYLPTGLSMAYNGTGRPEPVGAAMSRSSQPLHVHVNLDGREMATAIVPDLVGAVSDYGYMNSGRPTGKLIPGP